MDEASIRAAKLLTGIAESNYEMSRLANELRRNKNIAEVSVDFECSRNSNYFDYGTGSPYLFNWYLDASLADGRSLAAIVELFWDDQKWMVESRIETPGDNGPISVFEPPDREANNIDDLVQILTTATAEVIKAASDRLLT